MKKLLNVLWVLSLCLSLGFITACDGYFSGEKPADVVLEEAMEELNEKSYTLDTTMTVQIRMEYQGEVISETADLTMHTEADPTQAYVKTIADGTTQESYTKIENEEVKVYTFYNNRWSLTQRLSLDEYQESNQQVYELDTKDCFELVDGVYVGNVEVINEQLKDYMESFVNDFIPLGSIQMTTEVEKYEIILKNKELSNINIIMNMDMEVEGIQMKMRITMPLEFSQIGKTEVTSPNID